MKTVEQVLVNRFKVTKNYSLGHCYIEYTDGTKEYIGCSLERGWRDNTSNVSCVPVGTYPLRLERSPRFNTDLWELYGVPGRAECKFHAANYWRQLNGCIALGEEHKDIDRDGDVDITNSKQTMKMLHYALTGLTETKVTIKDVSEMAEGFKNV